MIKRKGPEEIAYLHLLHIEIEEGGTLADFNSRLGTDASHSGSESSVELEDAELVREFLRVRGLRQSRQRQDQIIFGRADERPVDGVMTRSQISLEQALERQHFLGEVLDHLLWLFAARHKRHHLFMHVRLGRLRRKVEVLHGN